MRSLHHAIAADRALAKVVLLQPTLLGHNVLHKARPMSNQRESAEERTHVFEDP